MGLTDVPDHLLARVADSRTVSLKGNGLNEVPRRMLTFAKLQSLDLSRNKIEVLSSEIGQLTTMRKLDLSHNRLSELPDSIGQLTQLESLRVRHNALEFVTPSIGNLTNLKKLLLRANVLTELPDEIRRCSRLQELDLSQNHFTVLPETVGSLSQLRKLHVSDNDLTDEVVEIDDVDAQHEGEPGLMIDRAIPQSVGELKKLKELDVSGNTGLSFLPTGFGPLEYASTSRMTVKKFSDRPSVLSELRIHIGNTPLPVELAKDGRLPLLASIPAIEHRELYQPPLARARRTLDEAHDADRPDHGLDAFDENPIARTAHAMPEILAAQTALGGNGQPVLDALLRSLAGGSGTLGAGYAGMHPIHPPAPAGEYTVPVQQSERGVKRVAFADRQGGVRTPSGGARSSARNRVSPPSPTSSTSASSRASSSRVSEPASPRVPQGYPPRARRHDDGYSTMPAPVQQAATQIPYAVPYMAPYPGQPSASQAYAAQPPQMQAPYAQPPHTQATYARPEFPQAAQSPALAELLRALALSSRGPQQPQPLAAPLHTQEVRETLFDYAASGPAAAEQFETDMVGVEQVQHARLTGLAQRHMQQIYMQGPWLQYNLTKARNGQSTRRDLWNLVVTMFRQHVICKLADDVAKENQKKLASDPSKTHLVTDPLPIALMYEVLVSGPGELQIPGFEDLRGQLEKDAGLRMMFAGIVPPDQYEFFRAHIMMEVKAAQTQKNGLDLKEFARKQDFWQAFLREEELGARMAPIGRYGF
ncbi:hypothetical protein Busp01_11050 [Trinickia caryophylli]|nr:hypothetical protein Busp01_11050 [Trinickia caryophylli]